MIKTLILLALSLVSLSIGQAQELASKKPPVFPSDIRVERAMPYLTGDRNETADLYFPTNIPPVTVPHSAPPAPQSIQRVTETRDKKQAVLVVGYRGLTVHDADRYALELVQETCSDLGSRLFLRVREKLGLAYYVGAQNVVGLVPGYFAFYAGTAPEKAAQVETELLNEAELLRTEGLTAEELKRSKAKVIGQRKIARQDLGGFAMASALDELYGLGYAHTDQEDALYEAVTLDQVKAIADKYLKSDALVIAVVKPETGKSDQQPI